MKFASVGAGRRVRIRRISEVSRMKLRTAPRRSESRWGMKAATRAAKPPRPTTATEATSLRAGAAGKLGSTAIAGSGRVVRSRAAGAEAALERAVEVERQGDEVRLLDDLSPEARLEAVDRQELGARAGRGEASEVVCREA